jgi:hypothetical protein
VENRPSGNANSSSDDHKIIAFYGNLRFIITFAAFCYVSVSEYFK